MNLSTAIFLTESPVRSVRVSYDPDLKPGSQPDQLFKTLDVSVKKDDMVVVPTSTRHGMTVCKVIETDFPVDYEGSGKWCWIIGKVDEPAYKDILAQEETFLSRVREAEEKRIRKQLADSMQLSNIDTSGLSLIGSSPPPIPAPPTPYGNAEA